VPRRHRSLRSPDEPPRPSREERKLDTRRRLLDAALALVRGGRSFSSLSLREVTRAARIVPNAFYRHFSSMDELALAIVDQGGLTLRRLLRQVREAGVPEREIVRRSVGVYVHYVRAHQPEFLFVSRERHGGSARVREAIRREVAAFANEMASDFGALGVLPNLAAGSRLMIAEMVVQLMVNAASDVLDLPPGRADLERDLVDRLVRQLIVVFLGARAWREHD
jgi:TetR/AcrR family transcriptional regulator, fatty acid biosynthesis regulator